MKGTIKRRREFEAVYDHGRRAFGEHLVVFGLREMPPGRARGQREAATAVAAPDGPAVRLGIVASRRVGGAVRRNRAKRVLRAAVQPLLPYVPAGSAVVLVARRSLAEPEIRSHAIQQELSELLARIEMLEGGPR